MKYISPSIEGWMNEEELQWLYNHAVGVVNVAEIGSYKGRSTHALLSSGAQVVAVDHFRGSPEHGPARLQEGLYREFHQNVGHFPNLSVMRQHSLCAASMFADRAFDMVFLDADHSYEAVKADILAWRPKARRLLCGHDYCDSWPGVMQAVRETIGYGRFETRESIWWATA